MKHYKFLVFSSLLLFFQIKTTAYAEEFAPLTVPGAITISTETANLLHKKGYSFVDVRSKNNFDSGHIPGAKHLAVHSVDFVAENLSELVKQDQLVVFYCNGVTCMGSSKAIKKAVEWGWQQVAYYRAGIPEWIEYGFAVE